MRLVRQLFGPGLWCIDRMEEAQVALSGLDRDATAVVEVEYDAAVVFIEFNEKSPSSVEILKPPPKSRSMSWSGSTAGFRPKLAARSVNDSALHPPNMTMPNEAGAMELRIREDDMESSGWVRPYVETAYQLALSPVAHVKISRVT
jgi:hypothetical protein